MSDPEWVLNKLWLPFTCFLRVKCCICRKVNCTCKDRVAGCNLRDREQQRVHRDSTERQDEEYGHCGRWGALEGSLRSGSWDAQRAEAWGLGCLILCQMQHQGGGSRGLVLWNQKPHCDCTVTGAGRISLLSYSACFTGAPCVTPGHRFLLTSWSSSHIAFPCDFIDYSECHDVCLC